MSKKHQAMKASSGGFTTAQIRNLLLEESKKFNEGILIGASVHDLERIQVNIKKLELMVEQYECGEILHMKTGHISPDHNNLRNIA